jgi:hypothetical protein
MYYKYYIKGISITYDRYLGKLESNFTTIFPNGTREEEAKKDFQKMKEDTKHYKDLSLFRQIYIYYEGEEEKIF